VEERRHTSYFVFVVFVAGVQNKRLLLKHVDSDENLRQRLRVPDAEQLKRRNVSVRTQTRIKKAKETLEESIQRMKMFRASMMDTAPPRAWALSLIITGTAVALSVLAMTYEWMTFDPIMKPKWARLL
jgi:hypothetical protein